MRHWEMFRQRKMETVSHKGRLILKLLVLLAIVSAVKTKAKESYVAFVLDGGNSETFANGKAWIRSCLERDCIENLGRIILSTSGKYKSVIGPMEKEDMRKEILGVESSAEVGSPELMYEIFKNALDALPNLPANQTSSEGCKVYAFIDHSILKKETAQRIASLSQNKNCVLNAVHIPSLNKRSVASTVDPSTLTGFELLLWLSKATGGTVITAEKPSTANEMVKVLEKEFNTGACKSKNISGPLSNGYACKEDCKKVGMCWDEKSKTCFCDGTRCAKRKLKWSRCPKKQCKKSEGKYYLIEHPYTCKRYYICKAGKAKLHDCDPGKVFSGKTDEHCGDKKLAPKCKKNTRRPSP